MKRDVVVSLVMLAGTVALYWSLSLMEEPRAALFPRVIILIMGALSLALLLQAILLGRRSEKAVLQGSSVEEKRGTGGGKPFPWGMLILCFVIIVIYFTVMEWLGFYCSAFLFFTALTFLLGWKELTLRKAGMRIGIAFVFTAILFILFNIILVVQTPRGLFI